MSCPGFLILSLVIEKMEKKNSDNEHPHKIIPPTVKERLPKYYRTLRTLIGDDVLRTRSADLARCMKITPSQVRQDFSYLGGIGNQGYGYNVKDLYSAIGNAIGIPNNYSAVIICRKASFALALASDQCFSTRGVNLKKIFTDDSGDFTPAQPYKYKLPNLPTRNTTNTEPTYLRAANYCNENKIDIAVLACDKSETDAAVRRLAEADIKGIWNFSGKDIDSREKNICIANMNMTDILLGLCCEMTNKNTHGTVK